MILYNERSADSSVDIILFSINNPKYTDDYYYYYYYCCYYYYYSCLETWLRLSKYIGLSLFFFFSVMYLNLFDTKLFVSRRREFEKKNVENLIEIISNERKFAKISKIVRLIWDKNIIDNNNNNKSNERGQHFENEKFESKI